MWKRTKLLTAFSFVGVSARKEGPNDLCGGPVERVHVAEFGVVIDGHITDFDCL